MINKLEMVYLDEIVARVLSKEQKYQNMGDEEDYKELDEFLDLLSRHYTFFLMI
jgi:hypothetical protein